MRAALFHTWYVSPGFSGLVIFPPCSREKGAARNLAQSLLTILAEDIGGRSPAEIIQIAKINGGHKLSPDLWATN